MAHADCDTELVQVRVTKDQAEVLSRLSGGDGVHSIERMTALLLHKLVALAQHMHKTGADEAHSLIVSGRQTEDVVKPRRRRRRAQRPS